MLFIEERNLNWTLSLPLLKQNHLVHELINILYKPQCKDFNHMQQDFHKYSQYTKNSQESNFQNLKKWWTSHWNIIWKYYC